MLGIPILFFNKYLHSSYFSTFLSLILYTEAFVTMFNFLQPILDCLVSPKLSKEDVEKKFSFTKLIELPSRKDYLRTVPGLWIKKIYEEIKKSEKK